MAPNSFKKDLGPPPPRYRTPSPPREAIELLSPHPSNTAPSAQFRERWGSAPNDVYTGSNMNGNAFPGILKRSGCAMDTLSAIASAIEPTQPPPPKQFNGQSALDPRFFSNEQSYSERPHKRARSEKLPSPDWHRTASRPTTSYNQTSEDRTFEAELLLNFSQHARFAIPRQPTPPLPPPNYEAFANHQIPQYRQAISPTSPKSYHELVQLEQPPRISTVSNAIISERSFTALVVNNEIPKESTTEPLMAPPYSPLSADLEFEDASEYVECVETVVDENVPIEATISGQIVTEKTIGQSLQGMIESTAEPLEEVNSEPPADQDDFLEVVDTQSQDDRGNGEAQMSDGTEEASKVEFFSSLTELDKVYLASETQSPIVSTTYLEPIDPNAATVPAPPDDAEASLLKSRQSAAAPSICAACNFARNNLTIETENNATSWINCDGCKSWFHFACAGFKNEREVRSVDKYRCRKCKPIHGATTYVRKSTRAHSAIDYAGLNEGVLKTSDENPEHHYIKPIKDGIIKFNPENFARMRPELVTAEYFERGDGMKEPIVIPASLNPRPLPLPTHDQEKETDEGDDADTITPPYNQEVLEQWLSTEFEYEAVQDNGQDALDMVIPQGLTVRYVSQLYGPDEKIEVIDVKSQNGEDKKWDMKRWVEYYESTGSKVVRNVISLEVSQSKLGRLIRRPKVVRDLDLQDSVWPAELFAKGDWPKVQFYCLMSVADCYTDFHIDFGGSSVFYHILKGKKTFFFIPPHERHLKKYEEWCLSPAQNWTFLGDQTKECYRVDLSEGDTMLIPAGWIHAVWTPEDSLVIGGNFLTRMHYGMQIRVAQIEKTTGVARKFRYPQFQKLLWFTALRYLEDDPIPDSVMESLLAGQTFSREHPAHEDFHTWGDNSKPGSENYHAKFYSKAELDGLPDLARYLQRTALIANGNITDGVSIETRNAVKRSIPKGHGDPLETIKNFAVWYTWKRGNEPIPHWAYPSYKPEGGAPELAEKRLSQAALRRLDREAALQAYRVAPERQSARVISLQQNSAAETDTSGAEGDGKAGSSTPVVSSKRRRVTTDGPTSSRRKRACETCRKRRRACKHREDGTLLSPIDTVEGNLPRLTSPSTPVSSLKEKLPNGLDENVDMDVPNKSPVSRMLHVEIARNKLVEAPSSATPQTTNSMINGTVANSLPAKNLLIANTIEVGGTPVRTPGRTKACKDCRKSKRRCIHDEFGNEDPIKAREAAIPRPSATKKRKSDAMGVESQSARKTKTAVSIEVQVPAPQTNGMPHKSSPKISTQAPAPVATMTELDSIVIPTSTQNGAMALSTEDESITIQVSKQEGTERDETEPTLPSLPTPHLPQNLPIATTELQTTPNPSSELSDFPEEEVHLIATSAPSPVKYEIPPEYNLSSQPAATALVSPPDSTHTDTECTPPAAVAPSTSTETAKGTTTSPSVLSSASTNTSRHTSRRAKTVQRFTPESARRASSGSIPAQIYTGSISGSSLSDGLSMSGSPILETHPTTPTNERRRGSFLENSGNKRRGSSALLSMAGSPTTAEDEESLRLIRELQAQDYGLRRRTSAKAGP